MRFLLGVLLAVCLAAGCVTTRTSADLTLEEKVGQLFVVVARGGFYNESSAEFLALLHQVRDNHVGGIHWASGSEVFETAFLTQRLLRVAKIPLLFSADLEAGPGMRLSDTTYWPWPMSVAATGDPELARRQGEIVAQEARAIGLNQIYAPVADVNVNPDNPVINVRSFGEDPHEVARFVAAFVSGVQSQGVLATAKHFPGHGDTATDSHRSLPILNASRERLEQVELVPFRAAIAAGVGAVMTAHLAVPALDATPAPQRPEGLAENPYTHDPAEITRNATLPASLSPIVTGGLLRGELKFQGLIVTDALDMGGLVEHFEPAEAAVRAVLAGADQVLKSTNTDAAIAGVRSAVASGRIPAPRLEESFRRVLAAKKRVGTPSPDFETIFRIVDSPAHRAVSEEIARRSLTLVREAPGSLPLEPGLRVVHVIASDGGQGRVGEDISRELKARLRNPPEVFILDPRSDAQVTEAALQAAGQADAVVLSLFVRFQSGRGTLALSDPPRGIVARIAAASKRTVAVSFGTPYLLREIPELATYIAAYGGQSDIQIAVARALFGEAAITGRLPVTIPGLAARGTGIQKASGRVGEGARGRRGDAATRGRGDGGSLRELSTVDCRLLTHSP